MTATATELRQRKILLVVLAVLILLGAVIVGASVLQDRYVERIEALGVTIERTRALQAVGAEVPALEVEIARLRQAVANGGDPEVAEGAPAANTPAAAETAPATDTPAADENAVVLISRAVERAAARAGARLDRVVPLRDESVRSVQFQLSGTRRALLATLAELANEAPALSIPTITIAAGRRFGQARLSMVVRDAQ
jgi:hypothetical protein